MIADVLTVIWKEFKELLPLREIRTGVIPRLGIPIFVLGVLLPLQFGKEWATSPITLLSWIWLPPFLVTSLVADSFAGERERHTMETLLASRLSDDAILFGKIGATVCYGCGVAFVGMLVGLVTINLAYGGGELLMYSADTALIATVVSILVTLLIASVGVLISLRAPTVRHAQQTLSIGFIILWFAIIYGVQAIPVEFRKHLTEILITVGETNVILCTVIFLILIDIFFTMMAKIRFKRPRLILD